MNDAQLVRISNYLSKHLRHQPQLLGLSLAPGGWVGVDDLLAACAQHGVMLSRAKLDDVVEHNSKQRFSFDQTGTRIRANQGHSVTVDLQLESTIPPGVLYHGTSQNMVAAIMCEGLRKMSRHHVHLSRDVATAQTVGARHGRAVVFAVDTQAMQRDGHIFYCSDNGVWLVDHVPPMYLREVAT